MSYRIRLAALKAAAILSPLALLLADKVAHLFGYCFGY